MAVAVAEEDTFGEWLADVEFLDDVEEFQCVRCKKVLIQHYVSNCGHSFCANCKRVCDDGSQQWKCPRCEKFIEHIDVRNEELEKDLKAKMVHCPNHKYDCKFVGQLQLIKNHLKQCEFTKEKCLPKLLEDKENKNMNLEQMFEINQRFYKLTTEMQEMRERIIKLESKDKKDETTLERELERIKSIVNGARSDMQAETNRMDMELDKMKNMNLAVEECKSKLLEFKGKSDSIYGLMDYKEDKLMKAITDATIETGDQFQASLLELRKEIDANITEKCGICMNENRNAAKEIDVFRVTLAQQTQKINELTLIHENEKLNMENANEDFTYEINGIKSSIEDLKQEINILEIQINENDINAQMLNTPNEDFLGRLNKVTIALNENIESTKASFANINIALGEVGEEMAKQMDQIISINTITKGVNKYQIHTEALLTDLEAQLKEIKTAFQTEISTLRLENRKTGEEADNKQEHLARLIEENREETKSIDSIANSIKEKLLQAERFITDLQIQVQYQTNKQEKLETDVIDKMLTDFHVKFEVLANDLERRETKDESSIKHQHILQLIEENNVILTKEMEGKKAVEAIANNIKEVQTQTHSLIRDLQTKQEELETDFRVKIELLTNQLNDKENKNESAGKVEYLHQVIEENKDKLTSETKSIESMTKTLEEKQIDAENLIMALQNKQQKLTTYLATVWKSIKQMINDFDSKHRNLTLQLESKETKDDSKRQFKYLTQQLEENQKQLHQIYEMRTNDNVRENQDNWTLPSEVGIRNNSKEEAANMIAGPSQFKMSGSTIANKAISNISSLDLEMFWPSEDKTTYNVLLLGQIGVGKSTFVNAFCNYFQFKDVKHSKNRNLNLIRNCDFTSTDQKAERLYFQLSEDSNERLKAEGQPSTKACEAYEFQIRDVNLRLIDTPGIGDGRGIEQDKLRLEEMREFVSRYKSLHAICILIKAEEVPTLTPTFKYCIKQLLSQLHRNSTNNLVFVFTNSQNQNSLRPYVQKYLTKIKSDPEIPFYETNIFCFENEIFKFLIDEQIPVKFDDEKFQDFKQNWLKSASEMRRLLTYIVENGKRTPHIIKESMGLDLIRQAIIELSPLLSKINGIIVEKEKERPISTFAKDLLENDLEIYENLKCKVTQFVNNLVIYLNGNAIVAVNNECEEHSKALITKENSLNKSGEDNQKLIKTLIDMLEKHRRERSILDKVLKDNKQNQQQIELENVEQIFLELEEMQKSGELKESENLNCICERYLAL